MLSDFLTRSHTECSVKEFSVQPAPIQYIADFVEHWHYSGNVNGLRTDYNFGLHHDGELIGGMIYGRIAMPGTWQKYAAKEEDLIELRRLCCIDDTPRNTESFFIGKTLKWLKKNTEFKTVISYADSYHGHDGTIYKASNFTHAGMTNPGQMIEFNGKLYHDKVIRNYRVDTYGRKILKPFAVRLKSALESGEAKYVDTPGKHIYLYNLR